MIPAGYVNSLVIWANAYDATGVSNPATKAARVDFLIDERDALVTAFLGGQAGKAQRTLTSGALNGKTFLWDVSMTREEKLTVITDALISLGAIPADAQRVRLTYAAFPCLER